MDLLVPKIRDDMYRSTIMYLKDDQDTLLYFFFINCTNEIGILTYNLNLNTMKNKAYCNWFYVPDGKFMEFWGKDVVDYEPIEGGWIFWVLN